MAALTRPGDRFRLKLQKIMQSLRAWLTQPSEQMTPVPAPSLLHADDRVIDDGVNYDLPAIFPGWLRREMAGSEALRKAITESETYNSQFGNPYRSGSDLPIMPVVEDPLREWDFITRERVLSNCHAAYQRNPLANAAMNFTADFVVGNGFNLVCKNPDVEKLLKAFIDNPDNAIRKYERQAVIDLQVDGELILRYYTQGGETVVVPQRPWEMHWIKTEDGFFRRPLSYHFQREETEGDWPGGTRTSIEDVPADEIQFIAINEHSYELRGKPELYRILPWLRADKEFVEDRARQNRWRGALLWHVKVANATGAALAAVIGRWRKPPTPGSAYVSSANEEVNALTNSSNASDAKEDMRAIRLMIVIGMRLPEYFFGDGSMVNLATATRQQLPALTKFEVFQQIMIRQVWVPMFERVIKNAVDAGILPEMVQEHDTNGEPMTGCTREARKAFEVGYEPVATEDLAALVNMLSVAVGQGWSSNQTAAERLGFDPDVERKRIDEEAQAEMNAVAAGTLPLPLDVLQRGRPEARIDDDKEGDEVEPNAVQRAAASQHR